MNACVCTANVFRRSDNSSSRSQLVAVHKTEFGHQPCKFCRLTSGDPESKDEVEADTSGDETDPVDPGHKARDEMFVAVASIRVGY